MKLKKKAISSTRLDKNSTTLFSFEMETSSFKNEN